MCTKLPQRRFVITCEAPGLRLAKSAPTGEQIHICKEGIAHLCLCFTPNVQLLDTQRNGASYRLAAEGIQKVTARLQDPGK